MEGLLYPRLKEADVILGYHNVVADNGRRFNLRSIRRSDFRRQLIYFKRNYQVVSLEEMLTRKNPGIKRLAITFDDGLQNNFTHAAVILRRLRIPATFFVCLGASGEDILWTDRLAIILHHVSTPFQYDGEEYSKTASGAFANSDGQRIEHVLKSSDAIVRKAFCKMLVSQLGFDPVSNAHPDHWKLLSEEQIRALHTHALFDIGSHGLAHELFTRLSDPELEQELNQSKQRLEEITQSTITTLSFPDGNYDKRVIAKAAEVGYKHLIGVITPPTETCVHSRTGVYHDRSWIEQLHALQSKVLNQ